MNTRIQIDQLEPKAYEAMMMMEKYLSTTTLSPALTELVRLRASQINGCAYCIELHASSAIKRGAAQNKLFALSAWWESPLFSEQESAALAITDRITRISENGVDDATFNQAKQYFTDHELAQMIMLIGTINTWNRIAISTHMQHEK